MAAKQLADLEVEYARALRGLSWGDQLVLQQMSYENLCVARRARVESISNALLDAARLKREIERKKAAGITS